MTVTVAPRDGLPSDSTTRPVRTCAAGSVIRTSTGSVAEGVPVAVPGPKPGARATRFTAMSGRSVLSPDLPTKWVMNPREARPAASVRVPPPPNSAAWATVAPQTGLPPSSVTRMSRRARSPGPSTRSGAAASSPAPTETSTFPSSPPQFSPGFRRWPATVTATGPPRTAGMPAIR